MSDLHREEILLSIVIPCYNIENYVGAALDSVLSQKGESIEIVVVDDGSTDSSAARAESALAGQGQIVRTTNQGVSAARNEGLRRSKGKYVIFLDGDDFVSGSLVSMLDDVVRGAPQHSMPDMICWSYAEVDDEGEIIVLHPFQRGIEGRHSKAMVGSLFRRVLQSTGFPLHTSSVAYRSSFLREFGLEFTVGCRAGEDREFQYRAFSAASSVHVIDATGSFYRRRAGSFTKQPSLAILDAVRAFGRALEVVKGRFAYEAPETGALLIRTKLIPAYQRASNELIASQSGLPLGQSFRAVEQAHPGIHEEVASYARWLVRNAGRPDVRLLMLSMSPRMYWYARGLLVRVEKALRS